MQQTQTQPNSTKPDKHPTQLNQHHIDQPQIQTNTQTNNIKYKSNHNIIPNKIKQTASKHKPTIKHRQNQPNIHPK